MKKYGWDLKNKKYYNNEIFFNNKNQNDSEMFELIKYFLEHNELIVLNTIDKFFNLLPCNNKKFIRNVHGETDSGKTKSELISQIIYTNPIMFETIEYSKFFFNTFDESFFVSVDDVHVKKINKKMLYLLYTKNIFVTLISESVYNIKNKNIIKINYLTNKKNNLENFNFKKYFNKFDVLLKENNSYGIFFNSIIEFLENNFDDIVNKLKRIEDSNINKLDKIKQTYKLSFNLMEELLKVRYNIKLKQLNDNCF